LGGRDGSLRIARYSLGAVVEGRWQGADGHSPAAAGRDLSDVDC